ncbi:MAG: DUF4367 domain-containing protein [Oscillospiraceae bacterium]|nr:DUF4367 domain-containing protein [Oscillospiraceae bacterium]
MFNKELYKETFSVLKAPDNTLLEVMKMKSKKKRVPLKAKFVIAAAVAVALTTTALAYGDSIVKFMFGDSTATKITFEEYDSRDFSDYEVACGIQIINRASSGDWDFEEDPFRESYTFEEIVEIVPFEVRTPSYNPLSGAEFMYCANPDNDSVVTFYYNGNESINIYQFYAGDDAYIEMENPLEMQTVTLGNGTEALALFYEMENQINPIDNGEKIQLYWMKDGSFYTMWTSGFVCDIDTMITIADSI